VLLCSTWLSAQTKTAQAYRIETPIKIDGVLDEEVYQRSASAGDFVQTRPYNGRPAYQKTEAWICYDQTSIYIGAMLYDTAPDSIFNFLTERDKTGISDYFSVYIDPYNEGQLSYAFYVTPAGVQVDTKNIKSDKDRSDSSWDAVWDSKTKITDNGWVVEMRIPYSSLRFPDKKVHEWGLNMIRSTKRYNTKSSWNLIDRNIAGWIHQQGQLNGINNIKPPVRLSFTPYMAAYFTNNEEYNSTEFTYKGGLDVKYGINESYTLDMMLIPDFGQTQSDDKQLNLTPYEVYYDERRQFFTEGMELFGRGDVFYSRRIGSRPKFTSDVYEEQKPSEIITDLPSETQLINATKISGRNKNGTAIGFLNAMSLNTYATLCDTVSGSHREVMIQPFTNYNVLVWDQSLNNNSYISIINTNMTMHNHQFMANVTATEFQIRDKSLTYAISGKGGISHRGSDDKETGWFAKLVMDKNKGMFRYGISQEAYSKGYNPNDMGFLLRNNYFDTEAYLKLYKLEPFGIFRQMYSILTYKHNMAMQPFDVKNHELKLYTDWQFMNSYGVELKGDWLSNERDYDEPRVDNRYVFKPQGYRYSTYIHSDRTKRISGHIQFSGNARPKYNQTESKLGAGIKWQASQKLSFDYKLSNKEVKNDYGYVGNNIALDSIYFAQRDVKTIENVLKMAYSFNNKLSLQFRGRHYWSSVENKAYYLLEDDGTLDPYGDYSSNHNKNFNTFNVDMVMRWVFAPGSEMTLGWKNAIFNSDEKVVNNYRDNIDIIRNSPKTNTLSFKILYYVDYNTLFKSQA